MKALLCGITVLLLGCSNSFSQSKTVDIFIPHNIVKGNYSDEIGKYRILTNEAGIITSITVENDEFFVNPEITVGADEIQIWSDKTIYAINTIKLDDTSIYVRGGERSIYTKDNNQFMEIKIHPDTFTIYEHEEIILTEGSNTTLESHFKVNPSKFSGCNYTNNTLIINYRRANNPNFKFEYEEDNGVIYVTYFYNMDEFIEYSSKIEIHGNIYSTETKTNVINYFIVASVYSLLADILFPTLFIENPIVPKN
ncbi:hypothetical protein [Breznakiella homolactica]|uniref:Auto-transporter adhesin head GIN domain-containing protein n=1 Tax=Breznakiella homolactica TaxID=2798577 RepID=A0A7T7XRD7_9SPIR|nr:hypothetical protein [Breznakiella homolactica]QQO11008.1 hypothetical protein JFL75_08845 [Breznakiella homolactica]